MALTNSNRAGLKIYRPRCSLYSAPDSAMPAWLWLPAENPHSSSSQDSSDLFCPGRGAGGPVTLALSQLGEL